MLDTYKPDLNKILEWYKEARERILFSNPRFAYSQFLHDSDQLVEMLLTRVKELEDELVEERKRIENLEAQNDELCEKITQYNPNHWMEE